MEGEIHIRECPKCRQPKTFDEYKPLEGSSMIRPARCRDCETLIDLNKN